MGLARTVLEEENQKPKNLRKDRGQIMYSVHTLRQVIDYYLLAEKNFKKIGHYGRLKEIRLKVKELASQNKENITRILRMLGQTPMLQDLEG